ncbi:TM2 domain-containing protein 2-like isoform X2 [Oratosquilla oratoria]|uniref:TM2 domain-containing protein 2-like isoform X2 n=1 Tax=Oratosquilla oratoria TaxID=337810 RepID=UPI003F75B11D
MRRPATLQSIAVVLLITLKSFVNCGSKDSQPESGSGEVCIPHSPKINCSYLHIEFLDCDKPVDHNGNHTARDELGYGCTKFGGQLYDDVVKTKVKCRVLEGIECCGAREFLRDGFPCIKQNHKISSLSDLWGKPVAVASFQGTAGFPQKRTEATDEWIKQTPSVNMVIRSILV